MTDVLLINGVTLPYHLLETGLQQALEKQSAIRVIFMYRNKQKDDQSSIKAVLTRPDFIEYNAHKNLEKLIRSNLVYVMSYFTRYSIAVDIKIVPNPTVRQVIDMMGDVRFIYLDRKTFTHPDDFAFVGFPYSALDAELAPKLQLCSSREDLPGRKKPVMFVDKKI